MTTENEGGNTQGPTIHHTHFQKKKMPITSLTLSKTILKASKCLQKAFKIWKLEDKHELTTADYPCFGQPRHTLPFFYLCSCQFQGHAFSSWPIQEFGKGVHLYWHSTYLISEQSNQFVSNYMLRWKGIITIPTEKVRYSIKLFW